MGQIQEVVPYLVDEGLLILHYVDDTGICMDNELERAKKIKLVLCAFEQLSELKINFHKSELFCCGAAKISHFEYPQFFRCDMGSFPFCYLGIPMHHKKLMNKDWKYVEEIFKKRLSCWRSKLLPVGKRLVLINSILSSLSMFMLFFFKIPREILKKLDYFRSWFF